MPDIRKALLSIASWGANFDGGHARWPESHTQLPASERPPWEAEDVPVNRHLCFDGQRLSYSGEDGKTERSDLSDGSVVRGPNCFEISLRLHQLPTNIADAWWWLVGPEIHGNSLTQAPIQPQILKATGTGAQGTGARNKNSALGEGDIRYFMDANAGRGPHRYWDLGPALVGAWVYFRYNMVFSSSSSASPFLEVYRGAERVMRVDDLTTAEVSGGYWKLPNYSNSGVAGTRGYDWCGARIWDGLCPDRSAGVTPPPPPPPPPPPSLPAPMKVVIDAKGAFAVSSLPTGTASILIGISGADQLTPPQTLAAAEPSGSFAAGKLVSGQVYWVWVIARSESDAELGTASTSFMPESVTPPPPPPVDPCATVEAERDSAIAAMNQAIDAMAAATAERDALQAKIDEARPAIAHAAQALG